MPGKAGDEIDEASAQQRFPAGQADLAHPELAEGVDGALDLVEGEDVLLRQPGVVLLRHAVGAAQVAAIDDGEAETFEGPAEEIVGRAGVGVSAHAVEQGRSEVRDRRAPKPFGDRVEGVVDPLVIHRFRGLPQACRRDRPGC